MLPKSYTIMSVAQKRAIAAFLQQRRNGFVDGAHKVGRDLYYSLSPADRSKVALYVLNPDKFYTTFTPGYVRPNGGHRILPSVYTRIKGAWLRSTGETVALQDMSSTHIKNCIALLEESHRNVTEKSNALMGKIFAHYNPSRPKIGRKLIDVAKQMKEVSVGEMYPIYNELQDEIKSRPEAYVFDTDVDSNVMKWDD